MDCRLKVIIRGENIKEVDEEFVERPLLRSGAAEGLDVRKLLILWGAGFYFLKNF